MKKLSYISNEYNIYKGVNNKPEEDFIWTLFIICRSILLGCVYLGFEIH